MKRFCVDLSTFFTQLDPFPDFLQDVKIQCSDHEFLRGNKLLLCIGSPYLRHLLEFRTEPTLRLTGVPSKPMEKILRFLHQGEVSLEDEEIHDFLNTASDLQIQGLDHEIADFLRSEAATPTLISTDQTNGLDDDESEADTMVLDRGMEMSDEESESNELPETSRNIVAPTLPTPETTSHTLETTLSAPESTFFASGANGIMPNPASSNGLADEHEGSIFEADTVALQVSPTLVVETGSKHDKQLIMEVPSKDNPVKNDPIEDGPIEDGPIEDGPIEDGPIEDGPIEDGPIEDGPIEDASIRSGQIEHDPMEDCSIEDGRIEYDQIGNGSMENEGIEDECNEDGGVEDEGVEDEVAKGKTVPQTQPVSHKLETENSIEVLKSDGDVKYESRNSGLNLTLAKLLRDISNTTPMLPILKVPSLNLKRSEEPLVERESTPLDDSGLDLTIDHDISHDRARGTPHRRSSEHSRVGKSRRRRYRLRPRSSMVMGISGKVWQCDNCDYWHYYQYALDRHQNSWNH